MVDFGIALIEENATRGGSTTNYRARLESLIILLKCLFRGEPNGKDIYCALFYTLKYKSFVRAESL